jgi:preprotein translocase subunit SecG
MNEISPISPLTLILLINSIGIIVLILNQNESSKDSITSQKSTSLTNPFEKITWIAVILQLSLLLIKIKTTDF